MRWGMKRALSVALALVPATTSVAAFANGESRLVVERSAGPDLRRS
jgi:hypothetical protein